MADQPLIITRIFDVPRQLVWKAWTDPEMFKKWWGPKDFSCPFAEIDLKVGGKYLLCMHGAGPGGEVQDFWSTGTYQEIVPMEKIVVIDSFSDDKGNVVPPTHYGMPEVFPTKATITITFEEQDGKTKMTLTYPTTKGIAGQMLDNMTQGWNQSFDKLAEALK